MIWSLLGCAEGILIVLAFFSLIFTKLFHQLIQVKRKQGNQRISNCINIIGLLNVWALNSISLFTGCSSSYSLYYIHYLTSFQFIYSFISSTTFLIILKAKRPCQIFSMGVVKCSKNNDKCIVRSSNIISIKIKILIMILL